MSETPPALAPSPAAPSQAQPARPILTVRELAKAFGPTRALRSCSFELRPGEVHAIVGENGSGKSTLVKILAGVHHPDEGEVTIADRVEVRRRSPRQAQNAGLVTVFQEVLVVGPQSVLDNIWLGTDGLFAVPISADDKRQRAQEALAELLVSPPSLDAPVELLSLSDRQACCIARALVRNPRVLILDESTSALDVATRDRLFAVVRRLCAGGGAVIFISHRMDEIEELADRITVLRSGESVATLKRGESNADLLVRHMTGEDHLTAGVEVLPPKARLRGDVLLRTEALKLHPTAEPIDIALRAGELIGLAGLEGHGADAFLQALRGAHSGQGRVLTGSGDRLTSPAQAVAAGVVYVPRDRRRESLFPTLPVLENFSLPTLRLDRNWGLVRWRATRTRLSRYAEQLAVRLASPTQLITALSGGNQQKIILARWLAAGPRVLLLNDPTRGVDLNAKRDLYRLLEQLATEGVAVVMLSTEVDEHVELMDRVLVFREGSISSVLEREQLGRARLISAFFGAPGGQDE